MQKLEKHGITVSSSMVRQSHKEQGWTLQQTTYCQLIRDTNQVKRLEFAQHFLESNTFHHMIFSEECSVHLKQYWRTSYWKINELTKQKPKLKHLLKVHVWEEVTVVDMVLQRFSSLMASWMPISIATSWRLHVCSSHSLERSSLFTGSYRIMM